MSCASFDADRFCASQKSQLLQMGSSHSHRASIPAGEEPVFEQLTSNAYAISFQGFRSVMEDAFDHCVSTHGELYAVYDGHGGKDAVSFAKEHLLRNMAIQATLEADEIRQTFVNTERQFLTFQKQRHELYHQEWTKAAQKHNVPAEGGGPPPLHLSIAPSVELEKVDDSGCCCLVAIVRTEGEDKQVTIAGVGDCTALLVRKDKTFESVIPHHKPEKESERILRAGLYVTDNRVNGELAVSRSMGDFQYKGMCKDETNHAVTCIPDVMTLRIDPSIHSCLLLFSDGISDGVDNEELAHLAVSLLENSVDGRMASMKASLLTSYEESRDNQVLLRIDF